MAKIDDIIEQLEAGFQNPQTSFGTTLIEDAAMEQVKVRRKTAGVSHHRLRYLSIGEMGQENPAVFWGHRLSDCIKKALEWRGLPTKSRRGPRQNGTQAQPQS